MRGVRPAFGLEHLAGELRRFVVVAAAALVAAGGGAALGIVQQGGGVHDLQVGAFSKRQAFRHLVDAQDVVKAVHGVAGRVPRARGLDVNRHETSFPFLMTCSTRLAPKR